MKALGIATSLLLAGLWSAAAQVVEPPPIQDPEGQPASDDSPVIDSNTNDPEASETASFNLFHEELAPYGEWVNREDVGEVWVPRVASGWRPYTTGHWANTDQGWAWMADEPWGWATFHYGRWAYYQDLNWAWVPGNVWAPAWVAWREGPGYLGWAPLPPSVEFSEDEGLGAGAAAITAGFFTFVAEQNFLAPRISTVIVPTSRSVALFRDCQDATHYPVYGHRVFNSGIDVRRIERATRRAVPQLRVASMTGQGQGTRGAKAPFYQPQAASRAARAIHGEFGHSLPPRLAAQPRGRGQRSTAQGFSRPSATTGRETNWRPRQTAPDRSSRPRPETYSRTPRPREPRESRQSHPTYTPDRTTRSTHSRERTMPAQPAPHNQSRPSRTQPRPQPQPRTPPKPSQHERHKP